MARTYANIMTAIWRPGGDFRKLPVDAQRAYLMLVTQTDISAAGTLNLTIRRWADLASDTTPDDIDQALVTLAEARYVVVDHDTEELLVRSFVRYDNGYGNSKRRRAILEAARDARSSHLRQALAVEFHRLGLPTTGLDDAPYADKPSDRASSTTEKPPTSRETRNSDVSAVETAFSHVEGPSHSPPDRASDSNRVVGTQGEYEDLPQPATPTPQPATPRVTDPPAPPTPPVTNPEEEGATWRKNLVDQVRELRPEWSSRSIARALSWPDVHERPRPVVAAAMLAVARDPASQAPGRLRADGPWWNATRTDSPSPTALPPLCGQCGPGRLVDLPNGSATRCPRCHPRSLGVVA